MFRKIKGGTFLYALRAELRDDEFYPLYSVLYILYSLYHRNGAYKTDVAFLLSP